MGSAELHPEVALGYDRKKDEWFVKKNPDYAPELDAYTDNTFGNTAEKTAQHSGSNGIRKPSIVGKIGIISFILAVLTMAVLAFRF